MWCVEKHFIYETLEKLAKEDAKSIKRDIGILELVGKLNDRVSNIAGYVHQLKQKEQNEKVVSRKNTKKKQGRRKARKS